MLEGEEGLIVNDQASVPPAGRLRHASLQIAVFVVLTNAHRFVSNRKLVMSSVTHMIFFPNVSLRNMIYAL